MPSITAEEAPRLSTSSTLPEVLGAFVGQVTEDPIQEVEILFKRIDCRHEYACAGKRSFEQADPVRKLLTSTWFPAPIIW